MTQLAWTAGTARVDGSTGTWMSAVVQPAYAMGAGARWLGAALRRATDTVGIWHRRDETRRELAALPDHTLTDIGLMRGDVLSETAKLFWKPVDRRTLELRRDLEARPCQA